MGQIDQFKNYSYLIPFWEGTLKKQLPQKKINMNVQ